ncbi:MAG: TraR/DksA C4-type zinc finger protein [Candidatus Omnitrophica bacterium]|nr:TraR/DksA C4-type zinc finger protein [Candidatus Omnitrophota bacterium]
MNKKNMKILRESLLEYRNKIVLGIDHLSKDTLNKSQKDASGDLSGYSFHMADMATDNYDRDFNLGLASSEREILKKIDEALRSIDDGSYGVCELCGCKISVERLKALPFATKCIPCKEKEEKKQP